MCKWLCKSTSVCLGVNIAHVRPFTWLCKCNAVDPSLDTADKKGNGHVSGGHDSSIHKWPRRALNAAPMCPVLWLCSCNVVGLGTDAAAVRPLNWLCKCNNMGLRTDIAPGAGHGIESCRAALCSRRHER